jgi:hypothetical protein
MFSLLPKTIIDTMVEYAIPEHYVLRQGITDAHIQYQELAANPHGFDTIREYYPSRISMYLACKNPSDHAVLHVLQKPSYISWVYFIDNPNDMAVEYICRHYHYLRSVYVDEHAIWTGFAKNPHDRILDIVFTFTNEQFTRYVWDGLSMNTNERAILFLLERHQYNYIQSSHASDLVVEYLLQHPMSIQWGDFCRNPNSIAVDFLFDTWLHEGTINARDEVLFAGRIDWEPLSQNPHDRVVSFLLRHPYCIDMDFASDNTNERMVLYVMNYPTQMNRRAFTRNPSIFQLQKNQNEIDNYRTLLH